MGPDGELEPLDEDSLREAVEALREADVEAVAVCLLFAFLHPDHERARRRGAARGAARRARLARRARCCRSSASTSASRPRSPTPTSRRGSRAYLERLARERGGGRRAGAAGHAVLGRRARRRAPRPSRPRAACSRDRPAGVVGAAHVGARERLRGRADLRHGRDEHRRRARRRRRGADDDRVGRRGRPDQAADGRRPHRQRRRRLDRLGRRRRRAARRARARPAPTPGPRPTARAARSRR